MCIHAWFQSLLHSLTAASITFEVFFKLPITYTIQYHLIFLSMKELTPEATTINCKIILFIITYDSIFSAHIVNIWNSLPNSVVDALLMHFKHAEISFGSTN